MGVEYRGPSHKYDAVLQPVVVTKGEFLDG